MSGVGRVVVAAVVASLMLGPTAMAAGDSVSLPSPEPASAVSIEEALASRRSVRDFADARLSLEDIAQLLWAAQGMTHPEGLRTTPSAGALYPLGAPCRRQVATLPAGIYRYDPRRHQLASTALGDRLPGLAAAAPHQSWIADAPAVVVITAVVVGAFSDIKVKRILGIGEEQPLLLIPVGKPR